MYRLLLAAVWPAVKFWILVKLTYHTRRDEVELEYLKRKFPTVESWHGHLAWTERKHKAFDPSYLRTK